MTGKVNVHAYMPVEALYAWFRAEGDFIEAVAMLLTSENLEEHDLRGKEAIEKLDAVLLAHRPFHVFLEAMIATDATDHARLAVSIARLNEILERTR